jgi:glycosyltransferase involved in cell wall biosynthesis
MPTDPRHLTVVVPVLNQAAEIVTTLETLDAAIAASSFAAEIVVVDDGSTDGTAAAVEALALATPVRVIRQGNRGRFEARRTGLEAGTGEYCLLLDSRVRIEPGALRFVEEQLEADPGKDLWNGHVHIETEGNPYGTFWDVITQRAFWAYFGAPRTTSFGIDEFERFPKGTTCLFARRATLLAATDAFRSGYEDVRHANDDTRMLRKLAAEQRINISPRFACWYSPRTDLVPFLRHAFHRGTVFLDGHGPESAWFPILLGLYGVSAGTVLAARRSPLVLVGAVGCASAAGAALALSERRPEDAPTMAWVSPLYAAAHVSGMWRGLGLLARARLVRRP